MAVTVANYIVNSGVGGKFVVLRLRDDPDSGILLFSDFSRDFQHHDIVRRWEEANRSSVHASGYNVAGGGWWKFEGDALVVYGQSAAYGRFDPVWVRERLRPGMVLYEARLDVR